MEMEKEKQALSEEQVDDVTGGLNWKKGAKVAGAAILGATAMGGAAAGGKKLYDTHKKDKSMYTEKDEPIYYMDGKGIGHDALNTAKSIDDVD